MASVCIVHTHLGAAPRGNHTSSVRWQGILEELGWTVSCMPVWDGEDCDVLLALHARRSHASIQEFRRRHPQRPLLVVATGTDIYNDESDRSLAHSSFEAATRIIVLQPLALEEIPAKDRDRGRVIYQSLDPRSIAPAHEPDPTYFDVAFLANARKVKDPLTCVRAAGLLPQDSKARILHMGSMMDSDLGSQMRSEARGVSAFKSLGSLPQEEALSILASCPLALSSSRHEGGANVVTEALALGVPLLASEIPGSVGLLGADYPGLFPVGDVERLCTLLQQAASDDAFLHELSVACQQRAFIASPALEMESFRALMNEL